MVAIPWHRTELLIIDLDNTLCDTFHTLSVPQWRKVEQALRKKGWSKHANFLKKNFGKHGFKHTLERAGMTNEQIRYAIKIYDDVDVRTLTLFPDAKDILDLDMPKILISRGEPKLQKKKLRHLGIIRKFDKIVILDTFCEKRSVFEDVLKQTGLAPKELLIVGDRIEEEITDGKRLGIPTVLVRRKGWHVAPSRFKPDLTVRTLRTVAEHLSKK